MCYDNDCTQHLTQACVLSKWQLPREMRNEANAEVPKTAVPQKAT